FQKLEITQKETPQSRAAEFVTHLEQHPYDNDAREQLALIYVQEFGRPELALDQLEQLVAQPHQKQTQIVRWINLIGDIHLKYCRDLAASRAAFQTIIDRYPKTA